MTREYYNSSVDQELLRINNLENFEKLWTAELDWFEPPNFRRSGWSGAARYELQQENGEIVGVFIKRQENHRRKTWRSPQGCPTFRIEWQSLNQLRACKVQVPPPLYYGERYQNGKPQAVLMTYELKGFMPLDEWLRGDRNQGGNQSLRVEILPAIADLLRRFHDHRFSHNALYPKHIMLKVCRDDNLTTTDLSLIDLEKSRRVFSSGRARIRDLDTLLRRCPEWTDYEKDLFLSHYMEAELEHLSPSELAGELWKFPLVRSVKQRIESKLNKE